MRSSDCGARGRGTTFRRAACGSAPAAGTSASLAPFQSPNASAASRTIVVVVAVADGNQRRRRRPDRARVKRPHVVDVHRRQRRFAADRRMAVRMRAVEQLEERAVGDGAGHVAQLRQPVQPQLPHAREVVLPQRRTHDDVGEQRERALRRSG